WNHSDALVMEDVGGIALRDYIRSHGRLSLEQVMAIALQLADSLHHLGQHRVVHKNINPANILIHPDTHQIWLTDFSLASLLPKEKQEIHSPDALEGTLAYIAPEQTGRMNRGIDYRADFYGLGVTLYELLTGKLPFQSNDPMELIHCHIAKTPLFEVGSRKSEVGNRAWGIGRREEPGGRRQEAGGLPTTTHAPLPTPLSKIVLKLMAKNAEDRYQSALGLKHDLQQCLNQWEAFGQIEAFKLGQADRCDRFLIPEKLYGRDTEVQILLDAFERVSQGTTELMLVAGYSGIGKTAVVNEVYKPITRQKGYFIKGKFDQFKRNIPFSALVQAFRSLMGQLLGESDTALATWKSKILAAVGDTGQVLVEVIPELAQIIGQQPAVPELSGTAAQNRFNLVLGKFIRTFTTADHPLVIFLDDLQWADAASLQLIQVLMAEARAGHLLILGAYRDNEVTPTHPLTLTLAGLAESGAITQTITLEPLRLHSLKHLIAEVLHASEQGVQPLAELVMQKTQGNSFFVTQFLQTLHQRQFITFDHQASHWQYDIVKVREAALTDDVFILMVEQLRQLPTACQNILKLAACIGTQFDLDVLAIMAEQSQADTATALWPALQAGLVLPQSEIYKFYLGEAAAPSEQIDATLSYQFLHDRVQQAAYSLIAEDQRQGTHLKMGQLLQHHSSQQEQQERLFEIVNHLNIGMSLLIQPQEREDLAALNLAAGQKAKAATAYGAAIAYLTTGIDCLPDNAWDNYYGLTLALHEEITEASYLNTDFEQVERWADVVLQQAQTLLDTVKVQQTRIMGSKSQGQFLAAIALGLEVLQTLGITVPTQPTQTEIEQVLGRTQALWADKNLQDLLALPQMEDVPSLAAMEILTALVSSAYIAAPNLMPLLICQQVELSIQRGNSPVSIYAYADYGLILANMVGDRSNGYKFGELALSLLENRQAKPFKSRVCYVINAFVKHWQIHLSDLLPCFQEVYRSGLETGDIESLCLGATVFGSYGYYSGQMLANLAETMEVYRQTIIQYKQAYALKHHEIYQQTILNLLGCNEVPYQLTGEIFNQETTLPELQATNQRTNLFFWYANQTILAYLFEQTEQAIQFAAETAQYLDGGLGFFEVTRYTFYDALIQLSQFTKATETESQTILSKVQHQQTQLQDWAALAPMNHQHCWDLVEAERCRVLGQPYVAGDFYDRAIAGAKENKFIQEEALANELAARFYRDWGKEKVAAGYMQDAYYCYVRWGAKAKTDDLERRYPDLLQPILQKSQASQLIEKLAQVTPIEGSSDTSTAPTSSSTDNTHLDFAVVLRAAQVLSEQNQIDELLTQLVQLILQNSGADTLAVVLPDNDDVWHVRAMATPEATHLTTELLADCANLPIQLIRYVKNTQEIIVIDDLDTELPIIDAYLQTHQPSSLLCLPIQHQGALKGLLYLQHHSVAGIFSRDRISILNFLCTQAASSLENAL
ncbi:MAG: AAA family ATPase, partial [Cyanobacteria bacterium P01_F01_bin.86]